MLTVAIIGGEQGGRGSYVWREERMWKRGKEGHLAEVDKVRCPLWRQLGGRIEERVGSTYYHYN